MNANLALNYNCVLVVLMTKRNVVICGSMSFYDKMIYIKKELNNNKVNALIPDSDELFYEKILNTNNKKSIDEFKSTASRIHINKIWQVSTRAILVVNEKKRNIDNYIGANTLAEIALAFALKKKIFLLYDYPSIYHDELSAWGAVSLMGDIEDLVLYITNPIQEQLLLPGINWDDY